MGYTDEYFEYNPTATAIEAQTQSFSATEQVAAQTLVAMFPATFQKARENWAKFKAGVAAGLFTPDQRKQLISDYRDYSKVWAMVRPNWTQSTTGAIAPDSAAFADEVDTWVDRLIKSTEAGSLAGLGAAPIVIYGLYVLGGIIVASVGWGFVKAVTHLVQESNRGKLIDAVVAGKIPVETLNAAIAAEEKAGTSSLFGSIFGDVGGTVSKVVTYGAIAAGLYLFWPQIVGLVRGRKS